ncbi:hypothetical protein BDW60DRAFT_187162, partial [Aspergillus nidulans var. acristatus]
MEQTNSLEERNVFFRGHAKIGLEHLVFQKTMRAFDQGNVDRLVRIFKLEGCLREESGNEIAAVINDAVLQDALSQSGISQQELLNASETPWLFLPKDIRLVCLYGKHRIHAARQALEPGNRWWRIALYDDVLPKRSQNRLACTAPNAKEFAFGDVLRGLRLSCLAQDNEAAGVWESKISKRGKEDMDRLARKYPAIIRSLDRLLPYRGLWSDICPTLLRRWGYIRCLTEITHYLRLIDQVWSRLFPDDLTYAVDPESVRSVRNLMPQDLGADCRTITQQMQNGKLFPLVTGVERERLLDRLLTSSGRILTLFSLAQDTLFLEPCAKALQQLVHPKFEDLRSALLNEFSGGGNAWPIQVAENLTKDVNVAHTGSPETYQVQRMMTAYLQLWLFAMRYIEAFGDTKLAAPYADSNAVPHIFLPAKKEARRRLAVLAQRLGFDSTRIQSMCLENTMRLNTRDFLVSTRPRELYEYPNNWEKNAINKVVQILSILRVKSEDEGSLLMSRDRNRQSARKRCGLPVSRSFAKDRYFLYIPHLCSDQVSVSEEQPTTFAIIRDIILGFFGREHFLQGFSLPWQELSATPETTSNPVNPMERAPSDTASPPAPVDLEPANPLSMESAPSNTASHPAPVGLEPANPLSMERAPSKMVSPPTSIDLDPHPTGTPPLPELEQEMSVNASNTYQPLNEEIAPRVPMAAGFEDKSCIAPINQKTYLSHNRSAKQISELWDASRNPELSVFYSFKQRQYRKFRTGDPGNWSQISSFVYGVANNHFFYIIENDEVVMLSPSQAIEVAQTPGRLVFVSTQHEHSDEPPMVRYWDYICSFDPQTGKRAANSKTVIRKQQEHDSDNDSDGDGI